MGHEPQTCEPSTPPGAAQAEPSDTSSACATAGDTAPSRSSPGLDLESKDADCLLRENLPAESLSGEGRKRRRQGLLDRLDAALRPPSESLFSGQRRDEHDDRTKGLGEKVKSGREYSPSGDHTPSGSQSGSRCRSGSPSERWQGLPLALDSALHERPVREVALTPGYEDFPFNNQIFECTTLGISLISALDSLPAFSTPLYSDEAALQEAEEKEEEAEEAVSALTRMESRQHKEETRDRNRYLVLQAFNDVMIDLNRRQSCLRPLERNRLFSTSIHIRTLLQGAVASYKIYDGRYVFIVRENLSVLLRTKNGGCQRHELFHGSRIVLLDKSLIDAEDQSKKHGSSGKRRRALNVVKFQREKGKRGRLFITDAEMSLFARK